MSSTLAALHPPVENLTMRHTRVQGALLLSFIWGLFAPVAFAQTPRVEDVEFFEKTIRPLLHDQCQSCHGAAKQKANLRLDSREGMLRGGDSGPAVVPGHPEKSLAGNRDQELKSCGAGVRFAGQKSPLVLAASPNHLFAASFRSEWRKSH
jgi:Planctomycete cytochrome C